MIGVSIDNFNDRNFKENYYIFFPTLTISNNPPPTLTISDKKFSRYMQSQNFTFVKDSFISMRQLLQMYGTEIIRHVFGDKFWIMRTFQNKGNIIISDLRFKTEFESVKQQNGIVIYIDRNLQPGLHASEKEVIDLYHKYDKIINNTGTLKQLFKQVKLWQKQL